MMSRASLEPAPTATSLRHSGWVRACHWIGASALLVLVFTGVEILMVHPRLYWGEAGNDLMPALLELPISRNLHHDGIGASWHASPYGRTCVGIFAFRFRPPREDPPTGSCNAWPTSS